MIALLSGPLTSLLLLAQQAAPAGAHEPGGATGTVGVVAELLKAGGIYTVAAFLGYACWKLYGDNQRLHQEKSDIVMRLTAAQVTQSEKVGAERQAEVREVISAVRTLADFAQSLRGAKQR